MAWTAQPLKKTYKEKSVRQSINHSSWCGCGPQEQAASQPWWEGCPCLLACPTTFLRPASSLSLHTQLHCCDAAVTGLKQTQTSPFTHYSPWENGESPQASIHFASQEPQNHLSHFILSSDSSNPDDNNIYFNMIELCIPIVPHSEIMSKKN